jgi:putative peptidoglycan lipid II flippase
MDELITNMDEPIMRSKKSRMAKDSIKKPLSENAPATVEAIPETPLEGGITPSPEPIVAVVTQAGQPSERREIVKSASLVALGNLGSSIMGMARQIVLASLGRGVSGPFQAALTPAQNFNDLLVNGSVSGVLIPTFNDYAAPEKRDEMRRLVFTIVNLILLVTITAAIAFFFLAPWLFNTFLASGFQPADRTLTVQYGQIIFFSLIALGPFAVLLSALYALKEFGWPAFATAAYHIGIIIGAVIGAVLGETFFGHYGLAFGVLIGALGEIALLLPGMRNQHFRYMFVLDLKHPALRRILKLYGPVMFSYVGSSAFAFLDQTLATRTPCASFMQTVMSCGVANFNAMKLATTLIQFPVGLVAAALSFAVLPTLTTHAREGNQERFKETLLLGFRLGLLLMIPAAAGLIALQAPIVSAIFQHRKFDPNDAKLTAMALQNYAYQLPFLAMDQLLISAFYARKNTIIPVAVFFVGVLGYLAVALPFWQTIGMPALAFANTIQNTTHAVVLLILLRLSIGSLHVRTMIPAVLKIVVAAAAMVAVAWGAQVLLGHFALFSLNHLLGQILTLVITGGLAVATYLGGVLLLKVEEVGMLKGAVMAKLGRK